MAYKKYQCRYFHSDGRSRTPNCNQGSNCRFLHPEDEDWPGLKPKPQERRVLPLRDIDKDRLSSHATVDSPPRRSEPRSAPLVSQDDLFLRRNIAEDEKTYDSSNQSHRMTLRCSDDFIDLGRDSKRNKDALLRNDSKNISRPYENVSYLGVKRPTSSNRPANLYAQKARLTSENKRKRMDDPDDSSHCTTRTSPHLGDRPHDHRETSSINPLIIPNNATFASGTGIIPPAGPLPTEERVRQVLSLFRDLSRLSSEVAQDAETQARDDKKLKAYTELSSTLAKVSSTAAAAVMPTLADILLRHAQGKQRVEDNLNALSGVWNQAFELFATEISHVVDAELEGALKKIREQAGLVHKSVLLQTSTPMPTLQRTDVFSSELSATNCFSDDSRTHLTHAKETDTDRKRDSKREQKRRRFSSVSPTPEAKVPQSAVKLESGVQEILNQMKTKIDAQAQSLQELTKENNELKASLLQRPSIASCTSFSTAATPSQGPAQVI